MKEKIVYLFEALSMTFLHPSSFPRDNKLNFRAITPLFLKSLYHIRIGCSVLPIFEIFWRSYIVCILLQTAIFVFCFESFMFMYMLQSFWGAGDRGVSAFHQVVYHNSSCLLGI